MLLAVLAPPALARPTDGENDPARQGYTVPPGDVAVDCAGNVCVHWVTDGTNADAPAPADGDGNGIPDWVDVTRDAFETAWDVEVDTLGFRAPLGDGAAANSGPNRKLDVYVADLGQLAGVCRSDDPRDPNVNADSSYRYWDAAVYCVVDNDFVDGDAPVEELQLTAAHELFHAVQCAYDCYEDPWIVEGTAAWVEGRVFPRLAARNRYLADSHLADPTVPLDAGGDRAYGAWRFWDFFAKRVGGNPDRIMRQLWAAAADGPDHRRYSAQAAAVVAKRHGTTLRSVVAAFHARMYPRLRTERGIKAVTLGRRGDTGATWRVDHLSARHLELKPGRRVADRARLAVRLNLPPRRTGPRATIVTIGAGGKRSYERVALNRKGNGSVTVPFGKARRVTVVVSNTSTAMDCNWETSAICGGYPRHDNLRFRVTAEVRQ